MGLLALCQNILRIVDVVPGGLSPTPVYPVGYIQLNLTSLWS